MVRVSRALQRPEREEKESNVNNNGAVPNTGTLTQRPTCAIGLGYTLGYRLKHLWVCGEVREGGRNVRIGSPFGIVVAPQREPEVP